MKRLLLSVTGLMICVAISAQSMKMVVDSKGEVVGRYVRTNANTYSVETNECSEIPKKGHRVVTFSAKAGQGVVYRNQNRVGNINVRKGPSTKFPVIAKIVDNMITGDVPDTYPCLGKENGWYKIRIDNGKVGYVREDMAEWDGMCTF